MDLRRRWRPQVLALHAQVLIARSYLPVTTIVDLHPFLLAEAGTVTPQQRAKTDRLEPDEARAHDEPPRGVLSEFP